jgi:DNA-binding transcriptional LysR family regulator
MNFAAFDLNLLRVFDALLRERSVTRAGERVGLSQPAVSTALKRLRHACGDQLFIRHGNDMVPTPRAEALADPIRAALEQLERAFTGEQRFDPALADRTFTLLGADFFSTLLIPKLAARMQRAAPKVVLRFLDSARGDVERLLRDDLIDAALERPLDLPDWVSRQVFFLSPFVIIAAREHPDITSAGVKPGAKLPIELFTGLPHAIRSIDGSLRGLVDEALEREGHLRRVVLGVPHFHGLVAAVAQTTMIGAIPAQFASAVAKETGLAIYEPPIEIPVPKIEIYWHRRHDKNPTHMWLREQILTAGDF